MRGIVMEITGKYAVILTQDGQFMKIKAQPGMTVGAEIDTCMPSMASAARKPMYRIASIAASFLLVLGIGIFSYSMPYSYVDFDINPSIGLTANIYDRIIRVEALNDDGSKLIENKNLMHRRLDEGVTLLLSSAVEQGYLKENTGSRCKSEAGGTGRQDAADVQDGTSAPQDTSDHTLTPGGGQTPENGAETADSGSDAGYSGSAAEGSGGNAGSGKSDPKGTAKPSAKTEGDTGKQKEKPSGGSGKLQNAVILTVSSSNAKKADELKKIVEDMAARELNKDNVESKILVGETSVKQREAAHKLGVTPGKLALIEEVSGYFPLADFEKMKNTAVKDLLEMVREKKEQLAKGSAGKKEEKEKEGEPGANAAGKAGSVSEGVSNSNNAKKGNKENKDSKDNKDNKDNKDIKNSSAAAGTGINTIWSWPGGSITGGGQNSGPKESIGSGGIKPGAGTGRDTGKKDSDDGRKDKKAGIQNGSSNQGPGTQPGMMDPRQNDIKQPGEGNGKLDSKNSNKGIKDAKPDLLSWDDVRKTLEKQGEKLKEERERLRNELLDQIDKDMAKTGNTIDTPRGKRPDAGKDAADNKKQDIRDSSKKENEKNETRKNDNRNDKNGKNDKSPGMNIGPKDNRKKK